ncbi:MAG: hypothetical protein KC492_38960, partial [Myxococcales bacterium]|nr:hypothetical protein [Myxococcales bacterium]
PMLEASIRRVTVTVVWKEGKNRRELSAVQFVTNPQQGGLDPNAAAGLEGLEDLAGGLTGNSNPSGTTGGSNPAGRNPAGNGAFTRSPSPFARPGGRP